MKKLKKCDNCVEIERTSARIMRSFIDQTEKVDDLGVEKMKLIKYIKQLPYSFIHGDEEQEDAYQKIEGLL